MMQISISQAVGLLKQGEVVAVPTETVYGLAADARNENALLKIFHTKQRPQSNPLIVHLADCREVAAWASVFSPLAQRLAQQFWPGPLTMVLPAHPSVSPIIRAGEATVALRVPAHPIAQELIRLVGGLAAPSANKYTQLSPTTAAHVSAGLGEALPVVDGGPCIVGIESTIVSVVDDRWQLLRPGVIDVAEITAACGVPPCNDMPNMPKAPGQHLLHYSPRTPCRLFNDQASLFAYAAGRTGTVALLLGHASTQPAPHHAMLPPTPKAAAKQLYAKLHALDALNASEILIELPADLPPWHGVRDRLMRAAYLPNQVD